MKKSSKQLTFFFLLCLIISFIAKQYIDNELRNVILSIKKQNIKNLEFKTNENFTRYGIQNIGENLRNQMIEMNIDNSNIEILNGIPFYFFQENKFLIKSETKSIVVYLNFDWCQNIFKIRGYQTIN